MDRTEDLMLAKHALSQLSYSPTGVLLEDACRHDLPGPARVRKADRPPRRVARVAKGTDVPAGA